jgi:hypothetical protein
LGKSKRIREAESGKALHYIGWLIGKSKTNFEAIPKHIVPQLGLLFHHLLP